DTVEIPPQLLLERCQALPVYSRRPPVRLYPLPSLEDRALGYRKGLGRCPQLFPPQRLAEITSLDNVAPSLHSHYSSFLATTSDSAPGSRFGISPCGGCHLVVALRLANSGSHVPWESLSQGHAAYIPVAACAVLRLPAG